MINNMFIDLVDACNLRCKTCFRGQRMIKNTHHAMDVYSFSEIMSKAKRECITNIHCYNWTEPFLHPDLPLFIEIIRSYGMKSWVSSNLSLKMDNLVHTIRSGVDFLLVSVSGFTQQTHSINHAGSNIGTVFYNLEKLSLLSNDADFKTQVVIHYIEFDYNKHETEMFRSYTERLGFCLKVVKGNGDPMGLSEKISLENYETNLATSFLGKHVKMSAKRLNIKHELCKIGSSCIVVDSYGDVFLCCSQPNVEFLKIGNFLEIDIETIFYLVTTHPFCTICEYDRAPISEEDVVVLSRYFPSIGA